MMSEDKPQKSLHTLDSAIETLSEMLKQRPEVQDSMMPEVSEEDIPVLSDIYVPEDEGPMEIPVLTREAVVERPDEKEPCPAEPARQPLAEPAAEKTLDTEELLRELENIVDEELEKLSSSARESIMENLRGRLDARLEDSADTPVEHQAADEKPVYLPMNNWKNDTSQEIDDLPLFIRKSDD